MSFWAKQHDYMDDFQTKKWNRLSENERLDRLQSLENTMAEEQNRVPRKVTPCECEGCGFYDRDTPDKLFINQNYVNSKTPSDQYDAMNTIIHEGRHAYQDDCVKDRIKHNEPPETVSTWDKNNNVYNSFDDDSLKYRFQPVESDAYDYADGKMESFQNKFSKDNNYRSYMKSASEEKQKYITDAQEFIGSDYQNKISKEIDNKINNPHIDEHKNTTTIAEQDKAYQNLCQYGQDKYGDGWRTNCQSCLQNDSEFRNLYQTAFPDEKLPPMNNNNSNGAPNQNDGFNPETLKTPEKSDINSKATQSMTGGVSF